MTIDEQELGRLLAQTADLASEPRFTAEELTRRAGRRRGRIAGVAFGAVAAVAAVAVIVPTVLVGRSQTGAESVPPPPLAVKPSYTVTINGRTQEGSGTANFVIKPGEKLAITVDMTIPAGTPVKVTGLWMGIANDLLSPTQNGPLHMAPIFVTDPHTSLGPGTYKWSLHWVAPAGLRPGGGRYLSIELTWPNVATERIIAEFDVQDNSLSYRAWQHPRRGRGASCPPVTLCDP